MKPLKSELRGLFYEVFNIFLGQPNQRQLGRLDAVCAKIAAELETHAKRHAAEVCKRLQEATAEGFIAVSEDLDKLNHKIEQGKDEILLDEKVE